MEERAKARDDAHDIGPRHRIKQMEAIVAEIVRETPDTVTLVLFTGNDHLEYKPGHFLTIDPHQFRPLAGYTQFLEDLKKKKEPPRAYSMSSSPHEKRLAVTVKEELYVSGLTEYPPLLSPYLTHGLIAGTQLEVTGFTGPYIMPDGLEDRAEVLLHVVAGSGSVPNLSMLKFDLETRNRLKHIFVYSNKTYQDIIFRDELDHLAARFPERLKVIYLLTREPEAARYGSNYRPGRLTLDTLQKLMPDPSSVEAFACGPGITVHDRKAALERNEKPAPRFLETAIELLQEAGLSRKKIHHESYG
jgi:3-ketosteroid 9alpha-monooxygenase subunit B